MYPVYCFWVGNAVVQVPLSGCLYDMVTFGLIGDFKTLSYVGGGGYCALDSGTQRMNAATAAANAGGNWKNYTLGQLSRFQAAI